MPRIGIALLLAVALGGVATEPSTAAATSVPRILGASPLLAPGDRLRVAAPTPPASPSRRTETATTTPRR